MSGRWPLTELTFTIKLPTQMAARRHSSSQCCRTTPAVVLAAWIGALYSVPRFILSTPFDSAACSIKAEYMYGHDFVYQHRYRWVSGRKCHVMSVLPNGVGCRAPVQAASAAPGVARQDREDSTHADAVELSFAWATCSQRSDSVRGYIYRPLTYVHPAST